MREGVLSVPGATKSKSREPKAGLVDWETGRKCRVPPAVHNSTEKEA